MPSYKLTYFNTRGRAEPARIIFALAGQPYEDLRLTKEEWLDLKPKTNFGALPIMEVDGRSYSQSRAIMYYLGRKFGFYPTDVEHAFKVDEVVFLMDDYLTQAVKAFFAPEDKEEKVKEFFTVHAPRFNGFLEKILKGNNEGKGYFVGDKITVADITTYVTLSGFPDALQGFPVLKAFVERVGSLDKVKEWVEKRPKTDI